MGKNQSAMKNHVKIFSIESNTKLCEISSDDEVKRNTCSLESLPEEILIQIFSFLPLKDLLNATLVSKKFNTIISNSSKLLRKIKYVYNLNDDQENCSGSRKYPNVQINCRKAKELSSFKLDKKSVKVLTFHFGYLDLHALRNFFIGFVNLEEFNTSCLYFNKHDHSKICPLPRHNLRKLILEKSYVGTGGFDHFMKLFTDWQVNELIIKHSVNLIKHQNIFKFLMNQNNLEYLSVYSVNLSQLKDAKFKLKSFKITTLKPFKAESLGNFLQNHQESLTELDIFEISHEIAEILNKFTKLKKLTVWRGEISEKFKTNTVESLTLCYQTFYPSFQFVKELHLHKVYFIIIQDMKYLHKLTIDEMKVNEIPIPTVKILTLITVDYPKRPFKFETSNLDELEIIRSTYFQGWLIDYLDRDETQLKKLKIVESLITPELVAAIERNCSKIEYFETVKCTEKAK